MSAMSLWKFVVLSLLFGGVAKSSEIDWPTLKFTPVATNIASPTHITSAGDGSGRVFIAEQGGLIKILQNGALNSEPFLNITNRVLLDAEQGLFSVCFPPGFASKGYFYVNYVRQGDAAGTVSRF